MDTLKSLDKVISALTRSTKAIYAPYYWTYTNDSGTETVEYIFKNNEKKIHYSRFKRILFITYSKESFELTLPDIIVQNDVANKWFQFSDTVHKTNLRLRETK